MTAVMKRKDDPSKSKGELMESNADAMEVGVLMDNTDCTVK